MARYGIPRFDLLGNVLDKFGNILARRANYDDLPSNVTITLSKTNGTWPGVPTTRVDTIIVWKGEDPSPPVVSTRTLGQPGMLNNVDERHLI